MFDLGCSFKNPSNDLIATYSPAVNKAMIEARLAHNCTVQLPTTSQLSQYPYSTWSVSRFAAYYNIHAYLTSVWSDGRRRKVLDVGESKYLKPFNSTIDIITTTYPNTDIHSTSFKSNSFDAVSADQVLEHTTFPPVAMLEIHRILRPGGLALITSVAYNPLHEDDNFHDFWRFMTDGFKVLSVPFKGGIKACGTWGTPGFIKTRAQFSMGSALEKKFFEEERASELGKNDEVNPYLIWMVLEK